jgi:hypothetical protein
MFTPEERAQVRFDLLEYAAHDCRISGVAITGSGATNRKTIGRTLISLLALLMPPNYRMSSPTGRRVCTISIWPCIILT